MFIRDVNGGEHWKTLGHYSSHKRNAETVTLHFDNGDRITVTYDEWSRIRRKWWVRIFLSFLWNLP